MAAQGLSTKEETPGAVGAATEGVNPEGNEKNVTIMTEGPAGYQAWPDIREANIPSGGLITPDAVAWAIAQWEQRHSGRQLMHRVENKPYGPTIHTHPELIKAVRRWYADVREGIAAYAPTSSGDVTPEASAAVPGRDEASPCSRFEWCDGHDARFPESDGAHMTRLLIATYGGEDKHVHAAFYLPTEGFDEPAHWVFSMPEESEWEFYADEVDRELDAGVAELEQARAAIREFLSKVGETSYPASMGEGGA